MRTVFTRFLLTFVLIYQVSFTGLVFAQSPGGISTTNLNLWLKADAIGVANGTAITSWNSSFGGYNFTTGTGTKTFYNTTPNFLVNFNPSVYFNGSGHLNNSNRLFLNTAGFTILSVARDQQSSLSGYRDPAGFGNSGNYPALSLYNNYWAPYFDFAGGQWNGSAARTYNGSYAGSGQQPQIFGLSAATGAAVQSYVDNFTANTGRINNQNVQIGNGAFIGSSSDALWTGTINEVVVYNRVLTAAELLQAESYLALKWGITLKGASNQNTSSNYLSSTGATIWDAAANASNNFNIAGIGRDDASGLNQKQSRSVNTNTNTTDPMYSGNMVTIGLGAIAATNAANANSFGATNTFMVWGDNGASSFQTTEVPTSVALYGATYTGLPLKRLKREWKVQVTGSVGPVALQFDLTNSGITGASFDDFRLLVDDDGDFSNATGITPSAWNSATKILSFTGITQLTNGKYFTVVSKNQVGPAGISTNLVGWYRADESKITAANNTTMTTWPNSVVKSDGTSYDVTNRGTPLYFTGGANGELNFNPFVTVNGNDDYKNANRMFANTSPYTMLAVSTSDANVNMELMDLSDEPTIGRYNSNQFYLYHYNFGGSLYQSALSNTAKVYGTGSSNNYGNIPQIWGTSSLNASPSGSPMFIHLDGFTEDASLLNSNMKSYQRAAVGGYLNIGSSDDVFWTGNIPEAIVYTSQLTATELLRVNTYLAIKYGISLRQAGNVNNPSQYLASNGSVIFNPATNGAYTYNIVGIGRDDASFLDQKQSRSQNFLTAQNGATAAGAAPANVADRMWQAKMLTIGKGGILGSNITNPNGFANDLSFTIWADDGLNPGEFTPAASTDLPVQLSACGSRRIGREWKAQVTGTPNTDLVVQYDLNTTTVPVTGTTADQFRLVVDEDGDGNFTTGSVRTYTANSYAIVASAKRVVFNNVTLNNGEVFTLVTLAVEDGIPFLVTAGTGILNDKTIKCAGLNGYRYFYDPVATNPTHKIFAINPRGNAVNISTTPASNSFTVSVDANHSQAELERVNAVSATVVANRLIQVTTTAPQPFTVSGGVRVRIYKNQAELDAAVNRLAQLQTANSITGNVVAGWFKYEGTISQLLATGITPFGLTGTFTLLSPDSTGVEGGVEFVEFWNVQNFSTFGYRAQVPGNLDVSGSVWADANGNGVHDPSESELTGGADLYVTVFDPNVNTVIAYTKVDAATGLYNIPAAITAGTGPYTLRMTTTLPVVGNPAPAVLLPTDYLRTGELIAGANDGGTPSEITVTTIATTLGNIGEYDFGIDRLPVTSEKLFPMVPNSEYNIRNLPGYLGIQMTSPSLSPLAGSDAEDCPASESCSTGKSFVIKDLAANTRVFYDGVEILGTGVPEDTINNFNPALFVIYGAFSSINQTFHYSLIDQARKISITPQAYTVIPTLPLPVTLVRFEVHQKGADALLNWRTTNEQNSNRFEIEQSFDGNNFKKIGTVSAAGNSNRSIDYTYTDADVSQHHTIYYRLKQIDNDGRFVYSAVVSLKLKDMTSEWYVYPQPFNNRLVVDLPEDFNGLSQFILTDVSGRVVYKYQQMINASQKSIVLSNLPSLANGTYILTIKNDKTGRSKRVIRQN